MESATDGLLNLAFPLPSVQDVASLSISSFNYELPAHQISSYHQYVCSFLLACDGVKKVDLTEENTAPSKLPSVHASANELTFSSITDKPRSYTPMPASFEENPLGAWTLKCSITPEMHVSPQPRVLSGKRVVIKDNIPIRGMPMYCGTSFCFTPLVDSPLITRCLAAGGTIVGKGQCEYMCLSTASHTASSGVVRNPVAPDYHAGGSSSGCAALVSIGEADLSIGCDQGGSCRIPAAMCGVVGCKPTHGLVPYTFIDGLDGPIDHAGPITRTVEDNALMLGVLAGWDGVDERASSIARSMEKVDYLVGLKEGVEGMKIGVVKEGLMMPSMEEDVKKAAEDSAQVFREMGAEVGTVSIPLHSTAIGIWVLSVMPRSVQRLFYSGDRDCLSGVDKHGKVYDRLTFMRQHLLAHVASWSFQFRIFVLAGEWLRVHFPESTKVAEVYKQRLIKSYASALSQFDVLLLPSTVCKSKKLPTHLSTAHDYEHASAQVLAEHVDMGEGLTMNTACFNLTGHPALSVPVGGGVIAPASTSAPAPASAETNSGGGSGGAVTINGLDGVALPIGVMLVGDYFHEASLYRAAYALEQARPWQSFLYCEGSPLTTASPIN